MIMDQDNSGFGTVLLSVVWLMSQ